MNEIDPQVTEPLTETPTETPVVDVRELQIAFDTPHGLKTVVNGVSFHVQSGEILGILGESGSGKTMSTRAILGLIDGSPGVVGGEIHIAHAGERASLLEELPSFLKTRKGQLKKRDRAWERHIHKRMRPLWGHVVTAIFQNPRKSLDPIMTIGSQLIESLERYHQSEGRRVERDQLEAEALEWLDRVQMVNPERVFGAYPHELSGGMCQRAMIAIALACKPALLIADEPTTGLDATVRAQIVGLLQDLAKTQGCAMLYISHDIREVLHLTQRVIVMRQGQVIERASTADLREGRGERHPYTKTLLDASGLTPIK